MSGRAVALLAAALSAPLAGCGDGGGEQAQAPAPAAAGAGAQPQDFPAGRGLTYSDVESRYPAELTLAIDASVMRRGLNRVPFVILDKGARPVYNAAVALYSERSDGTRVRGPFLAEQKAFGIEPRSRSAGSRRDAARARRFLVAQMPVRGGTPRAVFALVRMDGRLVATSPSPLGRPAGEAPPPGVGDPAPLIHTQTAGDVADIAQITTRVPPDRDLLQTDFADVVGRKPVVLTFASPGVCRGRVCAPVVDVVEEVASEIGQERVAFIHQEAYGDNRIGNGLRPQLAAYHLRSQPWTFVIDAGGRVAARFEGPVSVDELRAAVEKVL